MYFHIYQLYLLIHVIVLSNRPATIQYEVSTNFKKNKKISDLYTPEVSKILSNLRDQIEVAQNKNE